MGLLTYLRLKVCAVLVRLLTRFTLGISQTHQDNILHIASRNSARSIKVHVYKSAKENKKPSPVLLNLHGSGFIIPLHGSDDEFCARVARETDYTVLDMQYRLAPENPFPAALNDVEDAVKWVMKRPDEFDLDRFAISGFSAGGNLALATAGNLFSKDTFRSILLFYPSTDKSIDPGDRATPDTSVKPSPPALSRIFDECYIPSTVDRKNPMVSPSYAQADAFPKNVLFVTAAQDNLCLEAEALAGRIENAGGDRNVVRRRMEKCGHGWDKMKKLGPTQVEAKNEAYSLGIDMLRQ